MAENLPFISGKASVTAEAAPVQTVVTAEQCLVRAFPSNNHKPVVPVSVITMLSTAERPRRSCLWKLSIRFWSLVKECTVSMWPDWKAEEGRRKGRVAGPQTKALAHSYSPQCRIAPERALALVQWRWWYKKQRNRFAATKDAGIHNVVITVADTHSDRLGVLTSDGEMRSSLMPATMVGMPLPLAGAVRITCSRCMFKSYMDS